MGIFRKKVEFEDEKVPVSDGVKLLIAVIFIVGMFIGTYKVVELVERYDMKRNNIEYVEGM